MDRTTRSVRGGTSCRGTPNSRVCYRVSPAYATWSTNLLVRQCEQPSQRHRQTVVVVASHHHACNPAQFVRAMPHRDAEASSLKHRQIVLGVTARNDVA